MPIFLAKNKQDLTNIKEHKYYNYVQDIIINDEKYIKFSYVKLLKNT